MDSIERRRVSRAVILHVDDLGSTAGANLAFLDLAGRGLVTCGSVMVPCPWFRHLVDAAGDWPELDIGVHLTLTSEWAGYRWRPLTTCSRASGLVDDDGCFPRDVATLRRALVVEAAETELRAQVEAALAAGLKPTHLDAHMAAAMLPELLPCHIALAEEFGLWPVLPRSIRWPPDLESYRTAVATLDEAGRPVADHCRGTIPETGDALEQGWRDLVGALRPGVTHLALHVTAPGDLRQAAPDHAAWREAEYALLGSGSVSAMLAEAGVATVGCRAMQQRWLSSRPSSAAPQ